MQAFYKTEVARAAGVSPTTLAKWLKESAEHFKPIVLTQKQKLLPPNVVQYLCHHYCIDPTDLQKARKGQL